MPSLAGRSVEALQRVLAAKPGAVTRDGQEAMVVAVADAIEARRHLLVEGGTGTGKSLAYLVPAIVSGGVVVVSTATKTLQDQLANSELPFLAEHLGRPVTWAVVKGRQSYLCMAKLTERFGDTLDRDPDPTLFPGVTDEDLQQIGPWARTHPTGDRDDLDRPVSDATWYEVSVSGMECPGAAGCPQGGSCFAEAAFERARGAAVIITNHHLYGLHLATGRRILPEHGRRHPRRGPQTRAGVVIGLRGRRRPAAADRVCE